jgi:hypothetical protein
MSLDVTLRGKNPFPATTGPLIFIRENGTNKRITREEWDERFPDREPVTSEATDDCLFTANITHNLNKMAMDAGIYKALWRPEEIGAKKARDLVDQLTQGLDLLRKDPERFKRFNPENGWGKYETLVEFVERYLTACTAFPSADVSVWR